MSITKSISIVENFLESDACTSGLSYAQVEGIFVATICCSDYIDEIYTAELIVGDKGPGLDCWLDFGELREAWVEIYNHLDQQLFDNEYVPDVRFPVAEDATEPSKQIASWSTGFLMGFALTLQVWTDDFDLIESIPEFEDLSSAEEDVEMILALFGSFANWQKALAENDDPAKLQAGFPSLWQAAQNALLVMYSLALELQEIKLALELAQETTPYVRIEAKIGRNDPCPCGSGKKYKKCCLNE